MGINWSEASSNLDIKPLNNKEIEKVNMHACVVVVLKFHAKIDATKNGGKDI